MVFKNRFKIINGRGINRGISIISIFIINLLVRILLNKWKFRDRGLVKFFMILNGIIKGIGLV